jgi:hypothetical protein
VYRWTAELEGEGWTVEQTGSMFERVRQIVAKREIELIP